MSNFQSKNHKTYKGTVQYHSKEKKKKETVPERPDDRPSKQYFKTKDSQITKRRCVESQENNVLRKWKYQ